MIFGTDGIRGIVDKEISSSLAYDVGKGFAIYINKSHSNTKVVLGYDTRMSSYTYMSALASGLADYGVDVQIVGVVSTPIISFLVSRGDFSGGVMITASHNDHMYNGIKVFNNLGEKMSRDNENKIEKYIYANIKKSAKKGKIIYDSSIINRYIDFLVEDININLKDLTVALDCANGSNYLIAAMVYKKLGANVIECACKNDGYNINNNCGANCIENVKREVLLHNADLGVSFDGDGDRLRIVLKNGKVISGDDILYLFAIYLKKQNNLKNLIVVGTIMSNMGLEQSLLLHDIHMLKSDVGDKNVVSLMQRSGASLGGESSGHICLTKHIPSCDALYNSLFFIKCCKYFNFEIYDVLQQISYYPNVTYNIRVNREYRKTFDSNHKIQKAISSLQQKYRDTKIIVRPSGTESVIRVYVEGMDSNINKIIAESIKKLIKNRPC